LADTTFNTLQAPIKADTKYAKNMAHCCWPFVTSAVSYKILTQAARYPIICALQMAHILTGPMTALSG
jgi:hypothetical protein